MLGMITRNWWTVGLRGVAAIVFGVAALIWPGLTLQVLVWLFGAFALVDGAFTLFMGIDSHEHNQRWWAMALGGLSGIVLGVLTFLWPAVTGLVLLYFIGAWAIVTGVLEIVAAIELRRLISGEWAMILGGILSIAFGVLLAVFPGAGAVGLVWAIGIYAIVFGILLLGLAFRLRGINEELKEIHTPQH